MRTGRRKWGCRLVGVNNSCGQYISHWEHEGKHETTGESIVWAKTRKVCRKTVTDAMCSVESVRTVGTVFIFA